MKEASWYQNTVLNSKMIWVIEGTRRTCIHLSRCWLVCTFNRIVFPPFPRFHYALLNQIMLHHFITLLIRELFFIPFHALGLRCEGNLADGSCSNKSSQISRIILSFLDLLRRVRLVWIPNQSRCLYLLMKHTNSIMILGCVYV